MKANKYIVWNEKMEDFLKSIFIYEWPQKNIKIKYFRNGRNNKSILISKT